MKDHTNILLFAIFLAVFSLVSQNSDRLSATLRNASISILWPQENNFGRTRHNGTATGTATSRNNYANSQDKNSKSNRWFHKRKRKRKQNMNPTFSLIHDKTLRRDPQVERLWLMQDQESDPDLSTIDEPPVQILLTNIGWNQPNQTYALQHHPRGFRETYLMEGVVNNPWFHPTAWEDIESGRTPISQDIYYYVFFDKFQCMDHHWPQYGGDDETSMDNRYGRTIRGDKTCWRLHECHDLEHLFNTSRLFRSTKNVRMVYIDCLAWGHTPMHTNVTNDWPVSLAVMETIKEKIHADRDLGLPPPAIKPVTLTPPQIAQIADCSAELAVNGI